MLNEIMKVFRFPPFLLVALSLISLISCGEEKTKIKVLQFNIWQEGTVVPNGFEAIADEIIANEADLVAFSEVRNYHDSDFSQRIIEALAKRGVKYYGAKSYDSGLIARYPISSYSSFYPVHNDHGSITKAIVNVDGVELAFYSAHLDYLNCSYYDVRGYDGSSWRELDQPQTNIDTLLAIGRRSMRDDAISAFITDAKQEIKQGRQVILGGDFNEPSHLDWTKEMAQLYDHHGVVIDWTCSKLLSEAGFADSYRVAYPDPVQNPGFTYPSANKDMPISRLTWASKSDERERIDFIYYYPNPKIKLEQSVILGSDYSISYSKEVKEELDKFVLPQGVWPSDHKALISTFELNH